MPSSTIRRFKRSLSHSGILSTTWANFLQQLPTSITFWRDGTSPQPLIYLGYPVYTSVAQRNSFVDQLLLKVQTA
ncbi:hypothetical protein BCV72DRAFT_237398 [Rhizopus microsporus var. microsporus]|uniref:Uncharacterized protein n=1 Tax=Rhizopus microsporus var. microsporus TaxID=86635 RepID=A0A1X0QM07_RHIZD|nr:hypothetical protein BCV72DRAFT_237398 [Rhizopus microsporus var. microsporus]